ncbi:MAG: P-II family nitrogen regulator [Gammaproteobacteria bacterium]|nr:P-II family nitrogen regulator [Gammaproteobacteria bacterium]
MLKLVIAFVPVEKTDAILEAVRKIGATGATVFHQVRGEGLKASKTFLGVGFTPVRDAIALVTAESKAREILECIQDIGDFDDKPGSGIAIQIAVEDAVGLKTQLPFILRSMEEDT